MAIERSSAQAKRVLIVEDEAMIRMLLEDMLGELGYTIAAQAARIEEALEATQNADFDHAILDANLNGQPASPVADALVARGTPFVFATGYGEVPEPYCDRPTLKKPFRSMGLSKCCRARWIAVASKLVSRGDMRGRGKGRRGLSSLLRPSLFTGPRNLSSLGFVACDEIGITQPLAAHDGFRAICR
jgi:CheY-like chemotaxis protein